MKAQIGKFLSVSLVLLCILTFASLPQTIAVPRVADVYLKVTPEAVGAETKGELVVVDIAIHDLNVEDKLVALQWKLKFDASLIDFGNVTEGAFLKTEAERAANATGDDYGTYFYYQHDPDTSFVLCFTLYYEYPWPPEIFPEGSGTLATITFNARDIPEEFSETDLILFDVLLLDVDENEIIYDHLEHGKYLVPAAKTDVYLKVTPEAVGAETKGELVVVDIAIHDLNVEDKLVALQWKLRFDPNLLGVVDCTEGDFLKEIAAAAGPEYGTYFLCVHDPGYDYIVSGSLYYKMPAPPEIFPEGSGTLATITFNAISIPEEFREVDLILFDVKLLDVDGNGILFDHLERGRYLVPAASEDINIDGRVNIFDLYLFSKYFGTYPGHPRGWFARADVNSDGEVNIVDGLKIAKRFGKITTPKLYLKVEPQVTPASVSEEFSINITINDVEGPLRIVGVQWKLKFDTSGLEVLDVVEGDFFSSVAEEAGPDHGTYFWWIKEDNYVLSFTLLYREPWPPELFPEGSGTLATITFHAVAEGTYILELDDVTLLPPDVRYHHLEDGIVIVK